MTTFRQQISGSPFKYTVLPAKPRSNCEHPWIAEMLQACVADLAEVVTVSLHIRLAANAPPADTMADSFRFVSLQYYPADLDCLSKASAYLGMKDVQASGGAGVPALVHGMACDSSGGVLGQRQLKHCPRAGQ